MPTLAILARFRLTGGEHNDITEAANLIEGMQNVGAVVVKAFDASILLVTIEAMNATAIITPRVNRKEISAMKETRKKPFPIWSFFPVDRRRGQPAIQAPDADAVVSSINRLLSFGSRKISGCTWRAGNSAFSSALLTIS